MRALTESEIRRSFVNTTKGEATRLAVPKALATTPWDDLDFLGWRDPAAPQKGYLVLADDTAVTGVALRLATAVAGRPRRTMCSLCLTAHPGDGVVLMTARRGKQGEDAVGTYICSDLACSLYVRGLRSVAPGARLTESLSVDEQAARLTHKATEFVRAVRGN